MTKPSRSFPRPLSEFMGATLSDALKTQGFASAEILARWGDIVGPEVAARYGHVRVDGRWLFVDGIAEAQVPALVAELVARGGEIQAVVPTRHTLEERFMSLLGTRPEREDDDEPPAAGVARP